MNLQGKGFYFSSKDDLFMKNSFGNKIMKCYLSIKNPFYGYGVKYNKSILQKYISEEDLQKIFEGNNSETFEGFELFFGLQMSRAERNVKGYDTIDTTAILKNLGFDGIYLSENNVLVSRFFSMVKDQRDRLNKLRVLGDDCIWGEEGPDRGMEFCDRMAQDAEKMADAMMEVIKDMCRHFNGRTDVDDRLFYIDWVPDYSEEERFPKKEEVKKRRLSIFSRFFGGKSST